MEYTFYKLVHILGVIIFVGNIITGLFWMKFAVRTRDAAIIAHTMKGIIAADNFFTTPGVIVITAAGIMAAIVGQYPILGTGWILWPIILFTISGTVFMAKLAPLQRKIYSLASDTAAGDLDWQQFHALFRSWELWGLIATVTPIAAAAMMIMKLPR